MRRRRATTSALPRGPRPRSHRALSRAATAALLEWVVIALMVALAVEVTLGVVFRALGRSLVWYDEVASVLLAWLTFYGAALASVKRAHIGCPELVDAHAVAGAARVQHRGRAAW